jgi:hypothetical protein
MNQRRSRSDDILFISALVAILLGVIFLLYTTKAFSGALHAWPILIIAAGGVSLYVSIVRKASFYFLFIGLLFAVEGVFLLVSVILEWPIARIWPLCMVLAGAAGTVSGLMAQKRIKAFYVVPSFGFIFLGLAFALFSFGLVRVRFISFIAVWWPCLLIAGGIALFFAYGVSRRTSSRSERGRDPSSGP